MNIDQWLLENKDKLFVEISAHDFRDSPFYHNYEAKYKWNEVHDDGDSFGGNYYINVNQKEMIKYFFILKAFT